MVLEIDDTLSLPIYAATEVAAIPEGKDAKWSLQIPSYSWQVLSKEVEFYSRYGLIPPGFDHSFHVTLGGVQNNMGGPAYFWGSRVALWRFQKNP